jgi:hypothetical protein
MVNAFPIVVYDHHKCTTTIIEVHAKQDVLTCAPRDPKFTSQLWNCQRPYIRCTCNQTAKIGYKGNMLWFDHSIWYMVNYLGVFFPEATYPSLPSKFGAFLIWMKSAASLAVKTHITLMAMGLLMEVAALGYAIDSSHKFLAKHYDAPGARKIKSLFKIAAFLTDSIPTPQQKCRRLNMNVAPTDFQPTQFCPPPGSRGQFSEAMDVEVIT